MPVLLILLLWLLGWASACSGADLKIEVLGLDDRRLSVAFDLEGMFNTSALELIEKGFTAVLRYNVELWMVQKGWFDKMISENSALFTFEFNLLTEEYIVTKLEGEVFEKIFEGIERQAAISAAIDRVRVELELGQSVDPRRRCYVMARAEREPLTTDDIESLRNWLVGLGESESSRADGRFTRFLFRLAGDLFSYRNREVVSSQSGKFRLRDLGPVPEMGRFQ